MSANSPSVGIDHHTVVPANDDSERESAGAETTSESDGLTDA